MRFIKSIFILLITLASVHLHAQLGFCPGSQGEPIFTENFGNGMTYGPALPAGITTYPFVTGAPQDGFYTLYYHSNQYSTWHYSLDHTPDETNGPNGKMLLVNASAGTSGDFYKKTVTGLCVNTTFQFSAWVMNVYNPNSNYCGAGQIPINVRFEIWNATETTLLGSGNTGNIMGSITPNWQQFALVFTTVGETSVVLKMKNNGLGGCGNDLAIDDISFSACGELTTVYNPVLAGNTFSSCTPASVELRAQTLGVPHVYQWQVSTDAANWTDIPGANSAVFFTPTVTTPTYYRVRAAQDLANLNNAFCSTASNFYTVSVLAAPSAPVANGDQTICSDEPIPALSVNPIPGAGVNWYDAAAGGNLLLANSLSYTPTAAGTYYAEAYHITTNCVAAARTPVSLTVVQLPNATITATPSICSGSTAQVNFNGTPNATIVYSADGGASQTVSLGPTGSYVITTPILTANSSYTLVSVTAPALSSCTRNINDTAAIVVGTSPTASVASNAPVCSGSTATITFTGTANAVVTYSVNGGASQQITLDASGQAILNAVNVTGSLTYSLINVSVGGVCSQTLSQSIVVSAVALPTATISASPAAICSGQTSTILFSGTANANVTYTIDGGALQSITLDASGLASINVTGLTSNRTYALVGISTAGSGCQNTLSGSATITLNPSPTASFSSNAPVCSGTSATITFTGTPGAVVSYASGGGPTQFITLNGSGIATLTIPAVTSATTYNLISVTVGGCTLSLTQSITISAFALPTAAITPADALVCQGQVGTILFTGTPGATVTYSVDGGVVQTIILNASGDASVDTPALASATTFELIDVSLAGVCSVPMTDTATISVNLAPSVNFSGSLIYCDGQPTALLLSSTMAGTVFNWTVSQAGVTGAIAGSGSQIIQNLTLSGAGSGSAVYTVTPMKDGCSGVSLSIAVVVHPLSLPQITDGMICTVGTGPAAGESYLLDTQLSSSNHTFEWFFNGNPIVGALAETYSANQVGTYSVTATNSAGCVSPAISAVVGEMAQGQRIVVSQNEPFADNPTLTITVIGGDGPFLYQLDNGAFQSSNVFESVPAGDHTVTVVDDFCTRLSNSVRVLGYPRFFTPNGDGYNDTWNVSSVSDAKIRIFDRYGKLIKEMSSNGAGWDGTFNGRLLPASDYWFTIDYQVDGSMQNFRSHFTLKR